MSLLGPLRRARRRLKRYTFPNRIVSPGGVASSSLIAHLENGDRDRIWHHSRDKHCLRPELLPEVRKGMEVRALFLFGDPFHAVLSVFRRGLQRRHERSMARAVPGYTPVLTRKTTLEEYLRAGVPRFFLGEHLGNWVGYEGREVSILAVKYEALGDHMDEIHRFLGFRKPFRVRPRRSRLEEASPEVRAGLEAMYGELRRKVAEMPSLVRVTN